VQKNLEKYRLARYNKSPEIKKKQLSDVVLPNARKYYQTKDHARKPGKKLEHIFKYNRYNLITDFVLTVGFITDINVSCCSACSLFL